MDALQHLADLEDEGLISAIGLCNFDTIHTDEICTVLGPGVIVSNQVQVRILSFQPFHAPEFLISLVLVD